jgi:cytochrome c553
MNTLPNYKSSPLALMIALHMSWSHFGCSSSSEQVERKSANQTEENTQKSAKGTSTKIDTKTNTQTAKTSKQEDGKADPGQQPNGGLQGSEPDENKEPMPMGQTGQAFFTATVEPLFRKSCISCHTEPRQASDIKGPLTVYSYGSMKPQVMSGSGSVTNKLIEKVRGVVQHGGGDQCKGAVTNSPCKEIAEWWKLEMGANAADSGARIGRVLEVTAGGKVLGWAANPKNLDEQVMVKFYVGGAKGMGTEAGTATAFVNAEDEGTPGFHGFSAELPALHRNGKPNTLFVYATIAGTEQLLNEGGTPYTAWAPTAAGQAYFNNTVLPALNSCAPCHGGKNYNGYYASLFIQPPNKGGSATNNELINKMGGLNGLTHSGGNSCGGNANGGPCALIQNWWQMEFGTAP